jgi:protein-disulfide isomerase
VALLALVATVALVAVGGSVPSPTQAKGSQAATSAVTSTVAAGSTEEPGVDPTVSAVRKLSALVDCAGAPCPSLGSSDAPVTLIEISDFSCQHCRDFALDGEPVIEKKYVETGKVRHVQHVFGFNDGSRQVAAAGLCANEQGRFFAFKREAFEAQGTEPPDRAELEAYGQAIDLDMAAYRACLDENRYLEEVNRSTEEATSAGILGTPSFVLNGYKTEGNPVLDEYMKLIDAAIAAAGETS